MEKSNESRVALEIAFLADMLALDGAIKAADGHAAGKPFVQAAGELRALADRQERPAGKTL